MEPELLLPPLALDSWRVFAAMLPFCVVRQGMPMIHIPEFFKLPFIARRSACSLPFGTIIRYQYLSDEKRTEFVRHEGTHHIQWPEGGYIFFALIYVVEIVIYSIKYKNIDKGYASTAAELEAFIHEDDPEYLKNRKPYAWVKYLFKKEPIWERKPEILSENFAAIHLRHIAEDERSYYQAQAA